MEKLNKMHINYKDWQRISQMAKENNINTIAELDMYCRVWDIQSSYELMARLSLDCFAIVYNK